MMADNPRKIDDADVEVEEHDAEVEQSRPSVLRKAGKGLLKIGLGLFVLFIMLVIGSTMMRSLSLSQLQSASQSLDKADHWFQFIRWVFIASLIIWWDPINTWIAKRKNWNDSQLRLVLDMRWVALGVLIFVELIFIQRIYEWFIG